MEDLFCSFRPAIVNPGIRVTNSGPLSVKVGGLSEILKKKKNTAQIIRRKRIIRLGQIIHLRRIPGRIIRVRRIIRLRQIIRPVSEG